MKCMHAIELILPLCQFDANSKLSLHYLTNSMHGYSANGGTEHSYSYTCVDSRCGGHTESVLRLNIQGGDAR